MITLSDATIIALISLISSATGAFISPLATSWMETRKFKLQRKSELIAGWRQYIEKFDFENDNFRASTVFQAIRDELRESERGTFEAQRTYMVPPDGVTNADLLKMAAASAVTKVEQKWKLA